MVFYYCGILHASAGLFRSAVHEAWAFGYIRKETAESWSFPAITCQNKWQQNQYCLAHKPCSGYILLFGLCIEDRKTQTGRRKVTIAFQGTTSQEARQMRLSVSWTTGLDFKTFLTACTNALWGGKIQYRKLQDASVRQEEPGSQLREENNLSRQQLCREGPGGGWVTRETRSQWHHSVAESNTALAWTDWARSLHCPWSHISSAHSPAPRTHLAHACF